VNVSQMGTVFNPLEYQNERRQTKDTIE